MKLLQLLAKIDIEHMAALAAAVYGDGDIADPAFLRWQCFENPSGEAKVVLALDQTPAPATGSDASGNDTAASPPPQAAELVPIGESAQIPMRFRAFGKDVLAYNYVNTLIRKDKRSLALFHKIHKASFELCADAEMFYSLPNPNSYPLFVKLFAAATVGDLPLLLLPVRPKALIQKRFSAKLGRFIPNLRYLGLPVSSRGYKVSEVTKSSFNPADFDALWHAVRDRHAVCGVRDAAFVRWRFLDAPRRNYTVFAAYRDGAVTGYLACCTREVDDIRNAMLTDLVAIDKQAANALIKRFFTYAKQTEAQLSGALITENSLEYRCLKRAGFLRCPRNFLPQPFKLTLVNTGGEYHDLSNWFFTMADSDAI